MRNVIQEYEDGVRDFRLVNLRGADLRGVKLCCVKLCCADLVGANFQLANLAGADLRFADLRGVKLCCADLAGANLRFADLRDSKLEGADLRDANLEGVDLRFANLENANLQNANLRFVVGNGKEIKTFIFNEWLVNVDLKNGIMSIGCQQHAIEEWRNFSARCIQEMNQGAFIFWTKYKDFIFSFIDMEMGEKNKE